MSLYPTEIRHEEVAFPRPFGRRCSRLSIRTNSTADSHLKSATDSRLKTAILSHPNPPLAPSTHLANAGLSVDQSFSLESP